MFFHLGLIHWTITIGIVLNKIQISFNQVYSQPEVSTGSKNDPPTKKSKKSRHERPRSKYYETKDVDPNDNTWI